MSTWQRTYIETYLIYDIYYSERFEKYLAFDPSDPVDKSVANSSSLDLLKDRLTDLWESP